MNALNANRAKHEEMLPPETPQWEVDLHADRFRKLGLDVSVKTVESGLFEGYTHIVASARSAERGGRR